MMKHCPRAIQLVMELQFILTARIAHAKMEKSNVMAKNAVIARGINGRHGQVAPRHATEVLRKDQEHTIMATGEPHLVKDRLQSEIVVTRKTAQLTENGVRGRLGATVRLTVTEVFDAEAGSAITHRHRTGARTALGFLKKKKAATNKIVQRTALTHGRYGVTALTNAV